MAVQFFDVNDTRNRGNQVSRLRPEYHEPEKEKTQMSTTLLNLYMKLQGLTNGEEGQDLVEYALLVALIALVCVAGVSNVATAVNGVFSTISTSLGAV
jgi:pilus assembly protein Flp/PilA